MKDESNVSHNICLHRQAASMNTIPKVTSISNYSSTYMINLTLVKKKISKLPNWSHHTEVSQFQIKLDYFTPSINIIIYKSDQILKPLPST